MKDCVRTVSRTISALTASQQKHTTQNWRREPKKEYLKMAIRNYNE